MKRTMSIAVCSLFVVVMMTGVAFSAEKGASMQDQELMMIGTVNNANQIVDKDGQIFDVADTQEGKELVSYVGLKVRVKGTVLESEGRKEIAVSAYEIVRE
ncbi:MAG TPA: hypothetical protein DCY53_13110 [Desulfobacteraceae bacterium]|nr:hypothetical protein [Desulfobacteraceae bacterium]